jgi:hypothetical protein
MHVLNKILNKLIRVILLVFMISILISCEDIIHIDLKNSEPRLVIEGVITNQKGPYMVRISKSVDFYDPGEYPPVNNALVELSDDIGNSEVLKGDSEGVYISSKIRGYPGRKYTLKVNVDGQEYTAESQMENPVKIDSLKAEYFPGVGDRESGYYIHCFFSDPPDETNNYRLIAWRNGMMDQNLYLMDDEFVNGRSVDYYFYLTPFQKGDTVNIALATIDRPVFEYYNTLFNIVAQQGGNNPANPANPNTNLSNEALGYFGALAIDRMEAILEKRK